MCSQCSSTQQWPSRKVMASPKRPFQFTLMQLVWAVVLSALVFSVPPSLWLLGVSMTAVLLAMAMVLLVLLGPALVYWRVVHTLESRRPDWTLSDVVFSIGGTVCF